MKRIKPVSAVIAAMITLAGNPLNAARDGTSTNHSSSALTNASAPAQMDCGDAAEAAPFSVGASTNLLTLVRRIDSFTTVSNAQNFSAAMCCSEPIVFRNDFALRTDVLIKTPTGASARKTVHFFSDAIIIVSRSSNNAEWRDNAPATWSRFPPGGSLAGGDSAATREPRGLRLFSWSW